MHACGQWQEHACAACTPDTFQATYIEKTPEDAYLHDACGRVAPGDAKPCQVGTGQTDHNEVGCLILVDGLGASHRP